MGRIAFMVISGYQYGYQYAYKYVIITVMVMVMLGQTVQFLLKSILIIFLNPLCFYLNIITKIISFVYEYHYLQSLHLDQLTCSNILQHYFINR